MRDIIPGIVFQLEMQFVAYSVLLAETITFYKWQSITFIMSTCNCKDTDNKNTLIRYEEYYIFNNLICVNLMHTLLNKRIFLSCIELT